MPAMRRGGCPGAWGLAEVRSQYSAVRAAAWRK